MLAGGACGVHIYIYIYICLKAMYSEGLRGSMMRLPSIAISSTGNSRSLSLRGDRHCGTLPSTTVTAKHRETRWEGGQRWCRKWMSTRKWTCVASASIVNSENGASDSVADHRSFTVAMKFGGTSVGSAERMKCVADIITSFPDEFPVVVLSAMGKTTNLLLTVRSKSFDDDDRLEREREGNKGQWGLALAGR